MIDDLLKEKRPRPISSSDWDAVITGWCCNTHRLRSYASSDAVWQAWRKGHVQYTNDELRNGSRSCEPMYATKREAFVEMAYRLRDEYLTWQESLNTMASEIT